MIGTVIQSMLVDLRDFIGPVELSESGCCNQIPCVAWQIGSIADRREQRWREDGWKRTHGEKLHSPINKTHEKEYHQSTASNLQCTDCAIILMPSLYRAENDTIDVLAVVLLKVSFE